MQTNKITRTLLLPLGFFLKLYELALEGARDLHNKLRFKGAIIDPKCRINPVSEIEENCHILDNCLILNSTIKRCSYIGRNSMIQNADIGSFCSIANDVFIGLGTHPLDRFSTSPLFYRVQNTFRLKLVTRDHNITEYRKVIIGNDVWIGARATILDGVNIANGAVVAACAVVTKDIPPYAIVAGVPAKIVKYRFSPEKIRHLLKLHWWEWEINAIQKRMSELTEL